LAYEEIFLLVGIGGVLSGILIPFMLRGMNKGDTKLVDLYQKTEKGLEEAKEGRAKIIEQHRQDMHKVFDTLSAMTSDLRVHTNQIATFCIDISKIEERLRHAEDSIIRNERSRLGGVSTKRRK
jgi:hypothetical protein